MSSLAQEFEDLVGSLPDDWTDLELDLRIFDERRYVDAAVMLVTANPQPYSKHDWHWRLRAAHRVGAGPNRFARSSSGFGRSSPWPGRSPSSPTCCSDPTSSVRSMPAVTTRS